MKKTKKKTKKKLTKEQKQKQEILVLSEKGSMQEQEIINLRERLRMLDTTTMTVRKMLNPKEYGSCRNESSDSLESLVSGIVSECYSRGMVISTLRCQIDSLQQLTSRHTGHWHEAIKTEQE